MIYPIALIICGAAPALFAGMLIGRWLTRREDRDYARFWESVAMDTAHELAGERERGKAQDRFLSSAFRAYTEGRNVN